MTDYYERQANNQDTPLLGGYWSHDTHAGQFSTRPGPPRLGSPHAAWPLMTSGVGKDFKSQAPAPRPELVVCECSKREPTFWGAIVDFVLFLILLKVGLYVLGY